jgi:hypothetical protein
MKKTYFEPEMEVTLMFVQNCILDGTSTDVNPGDDGGEGEEDTNKRNTGKEATWGNLW